MSNNISLGNTLASILLTSEPIRKSEEVGEDSDASNDQRYFHGSKSIN